MDAIVNTRMLSHPVNWLLVWVIAAFGAFAWALIHEKATALPTSNS